MTNTVTNNQAVTVTGSIANTSLTTAQLASHAHGLTIGSPNTEAPQTKRWQTKISGRDAYPNSPEPTDNAGSGTGHNHTHTLAGTLTGTVAVTSSGGALSGTVTAAGNNAFSPYVVVNYIIKH